MFGALTANPSPVGGPLHGRNGRWLRPGGSGAVRANRKGSGRPACQWCSAEPVQELGPARADPVTGGVRRREATGNDPVYEIAHLPFDRAARLRFRNVPGCRGRVVFSAKTMSGLFVLALRSAPKTSPRQNPNENRVLRFIPVSYEAARSSFLWWLNHNHLMLVLEYHHSAVPELHCLAGRVGCGGVGREPAGESVNVVGAATLNKRPLDLRNLSRKTARHHALRVQGTVRLEVGASA